MSRPVLPQHPHNGDDDCGLRVEVSDTIASANQRGELRISDEITRNLGLGSACKNLDAILERPQ